MKVLTIFLIFAAIMLVLIPLLVSMIPSSPICSNKEDCRSVRSTLKTVSVILFVIMIITLIPAIYFIVMGMKQNMGGPKTGGSSDGVDSGVNSNSKGNMFLIIGLAALVILFGIITPLLSNIAKGVSKYENYPPKDDCPLYWEKILNEDGSYSCKSTLESRDTILVSNPNDPQTNNTPANDLIKDEKVFWDGHYNGGFLDNL